MKPLLIAEVKTKSPFGFQAEKSWEELFAVAVEHGDWLSIHTDPRWGGSFDLIKRARTMTDKPILAKGIHESDADIEMALSCGADYVLVVGRIPGAHFEQCLLEPLSLEEMKKYPRAAKVVWNSRNLSDGSVKTETFADALAAWDGWLCQASNIKTKDDIEPGADAILVGQNLEGFVASN